MAPINPPTWQQLPSATRSDLESVGCGRSWYEGIRPEHRIGSLNVYMKLKRINLWDHVDRVVLPVANTGPDEAGKFDFIAKDPARLRAELRSRPDFGDPGTAQLGWTSREDVNDTSLHFKHFGSNPARINAHIDKSGLSWNPITWLPHLVLDSIGDGYQDVGDLTELLRWHGLEWDRPITPRPAPKPFRIQEYHTIIRGTHERAIPGLAPLGSAGSPFRWKATTAPGTLGTDRPDTFPDLRLIGQPRTATRLGAIRAGRPVGLGTRPTSFDYRVRELPGRVRTGPGGRMEFPGVQITAHPRPNLLRELGQRLEQTPGPPNSRFDWTVRSIDPLFGRRPGAFGGLPGFEVQAVPRPNLLRELGDQLREPPSRYRFRVWQEPGRPHPMAGGGIEFPPMHIVAQPTRNNLLSQLGGRLATHR